MAINKVVYGNQTLIDLTTDTVASSDDILAGKVGHLRDGTVVTGTASGGDQHGTIWQDGQGYVHLDDESGIALQSKTATPTESQQVIEADTGYYALDKVTVGAISSSYVGSGITRRSSSDLTANGATVTAPAGYYSSSASKAVASGSVVPSIEYSGDDISVWVDNTGLVHAEGGYSATEYPVSTSGWINSSASTEVEIALQNTYQLSTQSAKTVTPTTSAQTAVAAGKYTTGAVTVAAMPTGTAGTPTATKGTVSNHAVTVTPSVTNTTGYISGGTKTGTAVTVSASELVSGTKTITENGTGIDVTNYASVDVSVSGPSSSSYELIASTTYVVNTSSTTAINVGTFQTGDTSIWTSDKMLYVKIRDTAGRRNGYYYGSDCMFANSVPGNNLSATSNYSTHGTSYYQNSAGYLVNFTLQRTNSTAATQGYGVYATYVNNDGSININARYNSSNTLTIDGTFKVDVYLLDWPGGVSPFNG